jgi:hypothetical protein
MSLAEKMIKDNPEKYKTGAEVVEPEKVEEVVVEPEKVEPEVKTDFDTKAWIKNTLEYEYDDENQFKERWSSLTQAEQKAAELELEVEKHKKTLEEADSFYRDKYGLTDNEIRRLQIIKEFPDSDATLLTKVITSDFSKTYKEDPIKVLTLQTMLKDSDIFDNEADAEKDVYRQFGIDTENVDENGSIVIPEDKIKALQKAAKNANREFDEIRNKIPIPEKTNLVAKKEEENKAIEENKTRLKNQWQSTFNNLADKALTKIKFEREVEKDGKKSKQVVFEFDVDENFRKEAASILKKEGLERFIQTGTEYSKDSEQKVVEMTSNRLRADYISKHFDEILLARENALLKEWADKEHEELHNPNKITGKLAPAKIKSKQEESHDAAMAKVAARFGIKH